MRFLGGDLEGPPMGTRSGRISEGLSSAYEDGSRKEQVQLPTSERSPKSSP